MALSISQLHTAIAALLRDLFQSSARQWGVLLLFSAGVSVLIAVYVQRVRDAVSIKHRFYLTHLMIRALPRWEMKQIRMIFD